MRILLTGADGFIGHHTAIKLSNYNFELFAIDNGSQNSLNAWHRFIISDRKKLIRENGVKTEFLDCRDKSELKRIFLKIKPDVIIHLAAIPSMVLANEKPTSAFENNVISTFNILEIIREEKLNTHVIFFSSSTVYGNFLKSSVSEDDNVNPIGIYEATKVCGETLIKSYSNLSNISYTIFRPSALYGERCINNRVSQVLIERALLGKPLKLFGGGDEKLDFTHIDDVVQGIYLAVKNLVKSKNQIFNLTRGNARPISDLVAMIEKKIGKVKVENLPRDKMRPKRGTLKIDKVKNILSYTPKVDLSDGYPNYIDWYLNNKITFHKLTQEA